MRWKGSANFVIVLNKCCHRLLLVCICIKKCPIGFRTLALISRIGRLPSIHVHVVDVTPAEFTPREWKWRNKLICYQRNWRIENHYRYGNHFKWCRQYYTYHHHHFEHFKAGLRWLIQQFLVMSIVKMKWNETSRQWNVKGQV